MQIAQAIRDTFTGANKALASAPPPFNFALAASVVAAGIANVAKISPRPLLIMHGTADRVVPPAAAKRLYEQACEPKELWMIDAVEHYEALQEMTDEVYPILLNFFDRCVNSNPV